MTKIVEIHWLDSTHDSGWKLSDDYSVEHQRKFLQHKTVGYILFDEKDFISVVQSRGVESNNDGTYSVDANMTIPKKAIIKITELNNE